MSKPSRTNELKDQELRYLPPALRDKQQQQQQQPAATQPPPSFSSSYRRPRAGTLPSNVHLTSRDNDQPIPTQQHLHQQQQQQLQHQQQQQQPPRPVLKHSQSVATSVPTSGRLRSESLTLPNLVNPFGASVFSTNWSRNPGGGFSPVEESSDIADDFDSTTLNYLGLAERPIPATLSELRSQQAALLIPQRNRSKTISGGPFLGRSAGLGPLATRQEEVDEDEYGANEYEDVYGASAPMVAKGFKASVHLAAPTAARPRATSVGDLERLRRPDQFTGESEYLSSLNTFGIAKTQTRPSPTVRFPPNGELARTISQPKVDTPAQVQTPSRSLWIGNLDSTMTSEALIHVFAPYGAIESLRLLPEKECGFVNFVDQNDAIRAKDDVLNRLGGLIGMPNGQAVRIGFGKADSAPVAPAKGSSNILSPTSPATGPGGKNTGIQSPITPGAGGDSSLQNSPTRALWIGSIPSTTTPATILSVFSPFGPIESARVLTHKNCGFVNFERLDDAVRARKALNGRDVLGSDVGAIRIGFARVPVKSQPAANDTSEDAQTPGGLLNALSPSAGVPQGVGELSVGATIHALRGIKGATAVPADQQVLSGSVENFRSNLLLSMIGSGALGGGSPTPGAVTPNGRATVTEQQLIMRELSAGSMDAEPEILALSEFRPPTMYYTTIPSVSERPHNRRWDASKLRELRKRLDSGNMLTEEIDEVAADFLDGEIVDLASDWLGNTVVQKLFEKCSMSPRVAMLERIAPHLAMIGIHKNGTWAAQKIIDCITTPEEIACVAQNLRPYTPPLLLDQFGNYVVQCCLKFGSPLNDFIFDSMCDRLWEIAQGRFGARSMRAILENPQTSLNQQRRIATAIILNSIPLATNPNGALLLTWLLDTSNFPARFRLLAPRFTPHLSHLCTHKLASLTVLRIINQKSEPEASAQILNALFSSPGDQVLTDVLGDQVNGVAVIQKILASTFIEQDEKEQYMEATKRVLTELKVVATQAYRRLIEDLGMPVPMYQSSPYSATSPASPGIRGKQPTYSIPGMPMGYTGNDANMASMMAALQLGPTSGPSAVQMQQHQQHIPLQVNPAYGSVGNGVGPATGPPRRMQQQQQQQMSYGPTPANSAAFSPSDPFNPFGGVRSPDMSPMPAPAMRAQGMPAPRRSNTGPAAPGTMSPGPGQSLAQAGAGMMGYGQPQYMTPQSPVPPHVYQAYMMQQMYPQSPPPHNIGAFHS